MKCVSEILQFYNTKNMFLYNIRLNQSIYQSIDSVVQVIINWYSIHILHPTGIQKNLIKVWSEPSRLPSDLHTPLQTRTHSPHIQGHHYYYHSIPIPHSYTHSSYTHAKTHITNMSLQYSKSNNIVNQHTNTHAQIYI